MSQFSKLMARLTLDEEEEKVEKWEVEGGGSVLQVGNCNKVCVLPACYRRL